MITKEQAKRLAEVAQAIADGKRVDVADLNGDIRDAVKDACLWAHVAYSIHEPPPEPKYRPWTLEEAIDNIGLRVRPKGRRAARLIGAAFQDSNNNEIMVHLVGQVAVSSKFLLEECEFLDGTPCGVRE